MSAKSNEPINPLPKNLEVLTEFDAIVIRRKWKTPAAYFMIFFTLFWDAFMVVWMSIAINEEQWLMAAFGSIHAAVGIGLAYFTVASFINHTDVRVTPNFLEVRHHPLPWFGKQSLPVHEIAQLYCKEKISRTKNGVNITYELHAIDQKQKQHKLLSGLPETDQVRYIENEIEKVLGIKNQTVSGELPK